MKGKRGTADDWERGGEAGRRKGRGRIRERGENEQKRDFTKI
jgi:hypothetical protein